jgi:hypothetical protein
MVLDLPQANKEIYRLVRKVAWDTSHSWRRDLFLHLYHEGEAIHTQEIADGVGFSLGTTHRQLHDMKALSIAHCQKNEKSLVWSLLPKSKAIIKSAKLEEV